ncbi:Uncharacterized protein LI90_2735 [Carbonactinospora thermoautotrophica]|uniref:DUF3043 domain-containing protein n=1 Tax=Carbonactinospora thermoautotrophica TaxID=1469144 RepID=A0A132MV35_9ACTN|nr:Uncharacterized protein LI90_2735 [Carbonactinospora thermoautotrophica]
MVRHATYRQRTKFPTRSRTLGNVFRRRSQVAAEAPQQTLDQTEQPRTKVNGKGRPTPKRREAERKRRQRIKAPKNRREAVRLARERARAERARMRQALLKGDERHLPPRDAGPVRKFVRDYIDSRRSAGELFLPGAIAVFALSLVPNLWARMISYWLYIALMLLVVTDSLIIGFGLRRQLRKRFPDEPHRGAIPYGLVRSLQIRKLRLPPPRVKPGDAI